MKNTYTIPLALVFCLFFLWAINGNLLPDDQAIDEDM